MAVLVCLLCQMPLKVDVLKIYFRYVLKKWIMPYRKLWLNLLRAKKRLQKKDEKENCFIKK